MFGVVSSALNMKKPARPKDAPPRRPSQGPPPSLQTGQVRDVPTDQGSDPYDSYRLNTSNINLHSTLSLIYELKAPHLPATSVDSIIDDYRDDGPLELLKDICRKYTISEQEMQSLIAEANTEERKSLHEDVDDIVHERDSTPFDARPVIIDSDEDSNSDTDPEHSHHSEEDEEEDDMIGELPMSDKSCPSTMRGAKQEIFNRKQSLLNYGSKLSRHVSTTKKLLQAQLNRPLSLTEAVITENSDEDEDEDGEEGEDKFGTMQSSMKVIPMAKRDVLNRKQSLLNYRTRQSHKETVNNARKVLAESLNVEKVFTPKRTPPPPPPTMSPIRRKGSDMAKQAAQSALIKMFAKRADKKDKETEDGSNDSSNKNAEILEGSDSDDSDVSDIAGTNTTTTSDSLNAKSNRIKAQLTSNKDSVPSWMQPRESEIDRGLQYAQERQEQGQHSSLLLGRKSILNNHHSSDDSDDDGEQKEKQRRRSGTKRAERLLHLKRHELLDDHTDLSSVEGDDDNDKDANGDTGSHSSSGHTTLVPEMDQDRISQSILSVEGAFEDNGNSSDSDGEEAEEDTGGKTALPKGKRRMSALEAVTAFLEEEEEKEKELSDTASNNNQYQEEKRKETDKRQKEEDTAAAAILSQMPGADGEESQSSSEEEEEEEEDVDDEKDDTVAPMKEVKSEPEPEQKKGFRSTVSRLFGSLFGSNKNKTQPAPISADKKDKDKKEKISNSRHKDRKDEESTKKTSIAGKTLEEVIASTEESATAEHMKPRKKEKRPTAMPPLPNFSGFSNKSDITSTTDRSDSMYSDATEFSLVTTLDDDDEDSDVDPKGKEKERKKKEKKNNRRSLLKTHRGPLSEAEKRADERARLQAYEDRENDELEASKMDRMERLKEMELSRKKDALRQKELQEQRAMEEMRQKEQEALERNRVKEKLREQLERRDKERREAEEKKEKEREKKEEVLEVNDDDDVRVKHGDRRKSTKEKKERKSISERHYRHDKDEQVKEEKGKKDGHHHGHSHSRYRLHREDRRHSRHLKEDRKLEREERERRLSQRVYSDSDSEPASESNSISTADSDLQKSKSQRRKERKAREAQAKKEVAEQEERRALRRAEKKRLRREEKEKARRKEEREREKAEATVYVRERAKSAHIANMTEQISVLQQDHKRRESEMRHAQEAFIRESEARIADIVHARDIERESRENDIMNARQQAMEAQATAEILKLQSEITATKDSISRMQLEGEVLHQTLLGHLQATIDNHDNEDSSDGEEEGEEGEEVAAVVDDDDANKSDDEEDHISIQDLPPPPPPPPARRNSSISKSQVRERSGRKSVMIAAEALIQHDIDDPGDEEWSHSGSGSGDQSIQNNEYEGENEEKSMGSCIDLDAEFYDNEDHEEDEEELSDDMYDDDSDSDDESSDDSSVGTVETKNSHHYLSETVLSTHREKIFSKEKDAKLEDKVKTFIKHYGSTVSPARPNPPFTVGTSVNNFLAESQNTHNEKTMSKLARHGHDGSALMSPSSCFDAASGKHKQRSPTKLATTKIAATLPPHIERGKFGFVGNTNYHEKSDPEKAPPSNRKLYYDHQSTVLRSDANYNTVRNKLLNKSGHAGSLEKEFFVSQQEDEEKDPLAEAIDKHMSKTRHYYKKSMQALQLQSKLHETNLRQTTRELTSTLSESKDIISKDRYIPRPYDWVKMIDAKTGKRYYYSKVRNMSRWTLPKAKGSHFLEGGINEDKHTDMISMLSNSTKNGKVSHTKGTGIVQEKESNTKRTIMGQTSTGRRTVNNDEATKTSARRQTYFGSYRSGELPKREALAAEMQREHELLWAQAHGWSVEEDVDGSEEEEEEEEEMPMPPPDSYASSHESIENGDDEHDHGNETYSHHGEDHGEYYYDDNDETESMYLERMEHEAMQAEGIYDGDYYDDQGDMHEHLHYNDDEGVYPSQHGYYDEHYPPAPPNHHEDDLYRDDTSHHSNRSHNSEGNNSQNTYMDIAKQVQKARHVLDLVDKVTTDSKNSTKNQAKSLDMLLNNHGDDSDDEDGKVDIYEVAKNNLLGQVEAELIEAYQEKERGATKEAALSVHSNEHSNNSTGPKAPPNRSPRRLKGWFIETDPLTKKKTWYNAYTDERRTSRPKN